MDIEISLKANYQLERREHWVVIQCPEMDIATQGETEELAIKNLNDAIMLFLESCLSRGTLDAALRELGCQCSTKKPAPGRFIDVAIPYNLAKGPAECHA